MSIRVDIKGDGDKAKSNKEEILWLHTATPFL